MAIDVAVPEGIRSYWNQFVSSILANRKHPIPEHQKSDSPAVETKPAVVERIPSVGKDIGDFWAQLTGVQKSIFVLFALNILLVIAIWNLSARLKVLELKGR